MQSEIKINKCYLPVLTSDKRYKVIVGGSGSGKSHFVSQKILLRITTEKNHRILCLRKTRATLRASVYQLLIDTFIEYGIFQEFEINKAELRFKHLPTGNEILLNGVDDPEKLKSIQGITSIWYEEASEGEEDEFSQIELRIRGEKENPVEFILTLNPIDENHWIKKRFFDTPDSDVLSLKTTYKDNKFLDAEYIKHLTERLIHNENMYRIYVLGEWGKPQTGQEFYHTFKQSMHTTHNELYDPNLPIWLSWDENVNPYLTCLVCQVKGNQLFVIDEICAKHPRNTIDGACLMFEQLYPFHTAGIYITGDATSNKQDVKLEKGYNFFRIIEERLFRHRPVKRVPASNPSLFMRGLFMNSIFGANYSGIQIAISNKCTNTIADLLYTKQNSDGTKLKETYKDEFGITCQKTGHTGDCLDYITVEAFKTEYSKYQRGDSKPVTILGKNSYNKSLGY